MQQRQLEERLAGGPVDTEDGGAPLALRLGAVLGGGTAAAIAGSLPATLRMVDGFSPLTAVTNWLGLSALLVPLGVAAVLVIGNARSGLRILAGDKGILFGASLLWGAMIELGLLSMFGAVLRRHTHHHGLAGVTFAVFALVSGIGVGLFSLRAGKILARFGERVQRAAFGVAVGTAFLAVLLVGFKTARSDELHTAAAMIDVLAVCLAATFAASRPFRSVRAIGIGGAPFAALVLLLGLAVLFTMPEIRGLLASKAPLQAFVFGLFG